MPSVRVLAGGALITMLAGCARTGFGREDAARICTTLQVCSPGDFAVAFGGSMGACTTIRGVVPLPGSMQTAPAIDDGLERPMREIYSCLLEARGDCARAGRCWAQTGDPADCSPASGIETGSCDGSVLSACTRAGQRFAIDCGAFSAVCGTKDVFIARFGACGTAACPGADTQLGCRGSVAEICQGTLLALADCASIGLRCEVATDGGNAACVGGASCEPTSASASCEGSVAINCTFEGQKARVDCAAGPTMKRCRDGQCVATGDECSDRESAQCEGPLLTFCQDGEFNRFDCVAEGFGPCEDGRCTSR